MQLNVDFITEYLPWYVEAAKLTVRIAFWGIIFSLIVGAACAILRYYRVPVIQRIIAVYIELSRNTPLLVQLFFLYFGLPKLGIVLEADTCAVIGLTFLCGSYMAESMRSGLESVDKSQIESAASLGMSKALTMREVIFPQALAVSVPGLCANVIFLIKETSVVSGIALADLTAPRRATVKIRHSRRECPAALEPLGDGRVRILFDEAQRACAPGQSAVFYDGEAVLGGGFLE